MNTATTTHKAPVASTISLLITKRLPNIRKSRRIEHGVGNISRSVALFTEGAEVRTYNNGAAKSVQVSYRFRTLQWTLTDRDRERRNAAVQAMHIMLIEAGYRVERHSQFVDTLIVY